MNMKHLHDGYLMMCIKGQDLAERSAPAVKVGVAALGLLATVDAAYADIAGMASRGKAQAESVVDFIAYAFYGVGFSLIGMGGLNGYKKSKGDPQITTGSIFGALGGGAALAATGLLAQEVADSMFGGGTSSSFGRAR